MMKQFNNRNKNLNFSITIKQKSEEHNKFISLFPPGILSARIDYFIFGTRKYCEHEFERPSTEIKNARFLIDT